MNISSFLIGYQTGNNAGGGSSGGGGSLPAGMYFSRLDVPVANNYHKKWVELAGVLYEFSLTGTGNGSKCSVSKFVDGVWQEVIASATLTFGNPSQPRMVELDGKIHILGGDTISHYIFDGVTVTASTDCPGSVPTRAVAVCNEELFVCISASPRSIQKWNPSSNSWEAVTTFSVYASRNLVSANNKLYYTEGQNLFLWENGTATQVATLSSNFYASAQLPMWSVGESIYFISNDYKKMVCKVSKYNTVTGVESVVGTMIKPMSSQSINTIQGKLVWLLGCNDGYMPLVLHEVEATE